MKLGYVIEERTADGQPLEDGPRLVLLLSGRKGMEETVVPFPGNPNRDALVLYVEHIFETRGARPEWRHDMRRDRTSTQLIQVRS